MNTEVGRSSASRAGWGGQNQDGWADIQLWCFATCSQDWRPSPWPPLCGRC